MYARMGRDRRRTMLTSCCWLKLGSIPRTQVPPPPEHFGLRFSRSSIIYIFVTRASWLCQSFSCGHSESNSAQIVVDLCRDFDP